MDVYTVVNNSTEFRRLRNKSNQQKDLELFPTAGPLDFVAIDNLRLLPETKAVNQFVVIVKDRYMTQTRVIQATKIMSTQVASIFFKDWTIPHGIPDTVLSNNGQQFVNKFFPF